MVRVGPSYSGVNLLYPLGRMIVLTYDQGGHQTKYELTDDRIYRRDIYIWREYGADGRRPIGTRPFDSQARGWLDVPGPDESWEARSLDRY